MSEFITVGTEAIRKSSIIRISLRANYVDLITSELEQLSSENYEAVGSINTWYTVTCEDNDLAKKKHAELLKEIDK